MLLEYLLILLMGEGGTEVGLSLIILG